MIHNLKNLQSPKSFWTEEYSKILGLKNILRTLRTEEHSEHMKINQKIIPVNLHEMIFILYLQSRERSFKTLRFDVYPFKQMITWNFLKGQKNEMTRDRRRRTFGAEAQQTELYLRYLRADEADMKCSPETKIRASSADITLNSCRIRAS